MNEFQRRLLDTVQNSTWIAAVARPDATIQAIEYYNYNAELDNLASGASGQTTIQIQSDSDFAIAYMSGAGIMSNSLDTQPQATVQITDTGTGKTFFYQPTLFSLVFGNGGLPFYLPAPRVLAPNTNLQINVNNLFSAAAETYYFNFLGARIYY